MNEHCYTADTAVAESKPRMLHVSVVIPTINRAAILRTTLQALGAQSEADFDVIVVCDGKDPQTEALSKTYASNYPLSWIFLPENQGIGAARNAGARAASGELLLFLDDDNSPTRELLASHRRRHQMHAGEGTLVVQGLMIYVDIEEPGSRTERLMRADRQRDDVGDVYCAVNPGFGSVELDQNYRGLNHNFSISRQGFWEVGGYDPDCRYAEDGEFGERLYDAGAHYVLEPSAIAYHRESKDLSKVCGWKAEMTARADVYRVATKGQRGPQTKPLAGLARAGVTSALKWQLYWKRPQLARQVASASRFITDLTGSRRTYELWRRIETATGYWQGVKSQGLTKDALRKLIGEPVPVLSFPNVVASSGEANEKDFLSEEGFLRIVRAIMRLKYRWVAPTEDLSVDAGSRAVVMTFEGYEGFHSCVFPHIGTLALKPLVFVPTGQLGQRKSWGTQDVGRRFLSREQMLEMHARGVEFGSGGVSGVPLTRLSDSELRREVMDSKTRLEDLLGCEVKCFAYPGGSVDARVRAAVARAGYRLAFSDYPGVNFWDDRLCLKRNRVTEKDTIADLALKLRHQRPWSPKLLRGAADPLAIRQ
jgi:GT2 family glycosyltransferase